MIHAGYGTASAPAGGDGTGPLLQVRDIVREYAGRGRGRDVVRAVSGVSFEIWPGETLGLVGETGAGKSTLARSVLQVTRPTSGSVIFGGADLVKLRGQRLVRARRQLQMVFQDPFSSLDPRWRAGDIVAEPLVAHRLGDRAARHRRVSEMLELVGLPPGEYARRRPRELSGGQCQRIAIARALAPSPTLVICDEAVSSLDVLIQAQVLGLLRRLRGELGLAYLFIAHDLAVVRQVSDRVAVMYHGGLCEVGPTESLFAEPLHPYTLDLLGSILSPHGPRPGTRLTARGEPASPLLGPGGCQFRARCPRAAPRCAAEEPILRELGGGRAVACHFPLTVPAAAPSAAATDSNSSTSCDQALGDRGAAQVDEIGSGAPAGGRARARGPRGS